VFGNREILAALSSQPRTTPPEGHFYHKGAIPIVLTLALSFNRIARHARAVVCHVFFAAAGVFLLITAASAEDTPAPGVDVELNAIADASGACTLTFVVRNTLATAIDQLVLETVMFDTTGQVRQLTLFEFGQLPSDIPRVRQFAVPGMGCPDIGQVLFNGVSQCTVAGAAAPDCAQGLTTRSRTAIEVLG